MIALTALAVPIIVHLHRRRKSKVIDWAAMQFLSHSLVNRRRGLTLEHFALLLCRCLLVVLFVLAMSRPQLTSESDLRLIPAALLGSVGLIALAWVTVIKSELWKRLTTAGFALVLIALAVGLAMTGNQPLPQWDQPRDVAIVIDASSSMNVEIDGESNFRRACEEARLLVDNLPGGSTVSMLLAGPVITTPLSAQANLRRAADEVTELNATGGGTNLRRAIEQSRTVLEKSPNDHKQIVVFSDNQLRSWQQLGSEADSKPTGDAPKRDAGKTDGQPDKGADARKRDDTGDKPDKSIEVFCRALPLPVDLKDVSVTGLELDAGIVSVHRPVRLVANLLNGGSTDAANFDLELLVNDKVVQIEPVRQLAKNSKTSVDFKQTFDQPGWNIVSARIKGQDRLRDNDVFHRVVHVAADLPVLIVNGDTTNQPFRRPATFLQLALDPAGVDEQIGKEKERTQFTTVDAIDAAEILQVDSLFDYQVILLCDVPRLPTRTADQLASYVEQGGGLWVIPGERCQRDFYNAWSITSTGKPLLPMQMMEWIVGGPGKDKPLELDFDSVSHVTLDPLLETGQHDLSELQVSAHWKFGDWPTDQPSHVAARLTNGDPLLIEHSVGRGRVLVTSVSFESLESNLISRISFPVLAHLWVEYLAATDEIDLNCQPHRNLLVRLDASDLPTDQRMTLTTPDGTRRPVVATVSDEDHQVSVEVGMAAAPGIYQLTYEARGDKTEVPFAVLCDEDEFDLTAASDSKLDELGQGLQIKWIADVDQIDKIARGSIEGIELWKYFVVGALAMIVIEVVVVRWILWRRRASSNSKSKQPPVAFPWQVSPFPIDCEVASDRDQQTHGSIDSLPPLVEAIR
ncbi:MAG: VWA domain-containing protein [Planctomycetales bacterium]|nr:VWA domain-containing protein [Planctomycetales bacterium]